MIKALTTALLAAAVLASAPACGDSPAPAPASTPKASASPSPPAVDYGQQYLADVAPMNDADGALGGVMTNKQSIQVYSRLSGTEQSAAATMLRQVWPASAKADIQALAESLSVESGDDAAVAEDFRIDPSAHIYSKRGDVHYTLNASGMATDISRDVADSNASTALAQKCRADLGLPPL
jgi:hypothetical protein